MVSFVRTFFQYLRCLFSSNFSVHSFSAVRVGFGGGGFGGGGLDKGGFGGGGLD